MQGEERRDSSADVAIPEDAEYWLAKYLSSENPVTIPENARGLNTRQAALYTSISYSWLTKARLNQTSSPGPNFIKVGRRAIYLREALDSFLDAAGCS